MRFFSKKKRKKLKSCIPSGEISIEAEGRHLVKEGEKKKTADKFPIQRQKNDLLLKFLETVQSVRYYS